MSKPTVLVTGAAGFVGANVVRRLLDDGWHVHAAVRKDGSLWRLVDVRKRLVIHSDIFEIKRLAKLLRKIRPDHIFHLAAYGSYPSQKDTQLMIEVNIQNSLRLTEVLRNLPYKSFVVAGSSSEYGKKETPMKEEDVLEPNNFYAVTKAAQTHLVQMYAKTYHKPAVILRLFNVYGLYEEKGRLVRNVIEAVLTGSPIRLATGKEARDFIYAGDIANAFVHVARHRRTFMGEVFNIGSGHQMSIKQLAQKVISITKRKTPITLNAYEGRPWDQTHWQADMKKTYRELGWRAKIPLTSGLQKTIEWYKDKNAK